MEKVLLIIYSYFQKNRKAFYLIFGITVRSEERRVGKECVG